MRMVPGGGTTDSSIARDGGLVAGVAALSTCRFQLVREFQAVVVR